MEMPEGFVKGFLIYSNLFLVVYELMFYIEIMLIFGVLKTYRHGCKYIWDKGFNWKNGVTVVMVIKTTHP
uniref:ATP synthase F0 subunit 8 n=1 Tax=Acrobeloides nanus TaxID=290746 RepID=A0A914D1T0_9BILA